MDNGPGDLEIKYWCDRMDGRFEEDGHHGARCVLGDMSVTLDQMNEQLIIMNRKGDTLAGEVTPDTITFLDYSREQAEKEFF